ncbi:MAG: type II toxin-antitoxin system HicB family antitoxin [Treponema sp.]|jgi:predicted RNase H-like HicB family nuclease|nr:type II toxin-antitoxin system HicB family antitoxin [Treponema sp.]
MDIEYTYWYDKSSKYYVGYLNIFPEHTTQGKSIKELEMMLSELYEFYKIENTVKQYGKIRVEA